MTLVDSVHQFRLHAMSYAAALGNVSQACRDLGISRTLFYRWKARFERYGSDGLRPGQRKASLHPGQTPPHLERSVLAWAIAEPTWGPLRLSSELRRQRGLVLHPSTVYRILKRHGLRTRFERLVVLEQHSAETAGLLTERTRRQLLRAQGQKPRHIQASVPGELVCIDTFYIGKLKGGGKVWQYTACDAATSFGVARLITGNWSAKKSAAFLREAVVPAFDKQGFEIQRVLTDCGREYYGEFDKACVAKAIQHTRTKPRHAWTNGFVERLQGTILRELWRVAFRRRFFISVTQMQRDLDGYLEYYNFERVHHGYRTKGRTPSEVIKAHSNKTEVSL
ncbi:MAG: IS481 family transposase [bacterium]|nr:MAG: IS481 family transposase [bacterium]